MYVSTAGGSDFAVSARGPRGGGGGGKGLLRSPPVCGLPCSPALFLFLCALLLEATSSRAVKLSVETMVHDIPILKDGRGAKLIYIEVYKFGLGGRSAL